jgi:signal transduction histidine kinase
VVAGLALTAAIGLGLLIMYLVQLSSAHHTIDDQLRTYAVQISQAGQAGTWPHPLPASPVDPDAAAKVLARDGTVLAASRPRHGEQTGLVSVRATVAGERVTIVTSTSTDLVKQIGETYSRLILFGIPVILILACGTVWLVVGRALLPVGRIRQTVTEITAADLSQRVPEPGTGDEIADLAGTMNDMLTRLDDAAARQRRFTADASHELRSPLAAIRTTLEVALAHPDQAPWPDIVGRAIRQTERLEALIQQLLLLARADDRQLTAQRQLVDISALLDEVRAATAAGAVTIDLHPAAGATTYGDPHLLERMFRNVLDNAVRYAKQRVLIHVAVADGTVQVAISDDGPGIPEAESERVFSRFVRLDPSRERASGSSGLGLAIAREIATSHGGSIAIDDSPDGGALVAITLPHARPAPSQTRSG